MQTLPGFRPGMTAQKAHQALKTALIIEEKAHQCSLEWFGEIYYRKLFKKLGFSSINRYARVALGFSETKIGDYLHLTQKLKDLPVLRETLKTGKLGYTSGRVIAGVADQSTEKQWVEFALDHSRREVEAEAKRASCAGENVATSIFLRFNLSLILQPNLRRSRYAPVLGLRPGSILFASSTAPNSLVT